MSEKVAARKLNNKPINRFGFRQERGGPHLARTIMLKEVRHLFSFVDDPDSGKEVYFQSIVDENCLSKRSDKTRKLTARHLILTT